MRRLNLIILTRSKLGLQNCLNVLSSYCNSWILRINPKKTKIMIFQRCTRKCEHNFRIGNEVIDVVQNYTYLGTRITSSGNFTLSLEHLRQKALHALQITFTRYFNISSYEFFWLFNKLSISFIYLAMLWIKNQININEWMNEWEL